MVPYAAAMRFVRELLVGMTTVLGAIMALGSVDGRNVYWLLAGGLLLIVSRIEALNLDADRRAVRDRPALDPEP